MAIVLLAASSCAGGGHFDTMVGRSFRSVADGVMAAASVNLDSATAAWTSADVGRTACVLGAGAAGIPLVSRIATLVSPTRVTLQDPASVAVSGKVVHVVQTGSLRSFQIDNSTTLDQVTEEEVNAATIAWSKLNRARGATMQQARGQVILADVPLT
jgi:hypothetical protein